MWKINFIYFVYIINLLLNNDLVINIFINILNN